MLDDDNENGTLICFEHSLQRGKVRSVVAEIATSDHGDDIDRRLLSVPRRLLRRSSCSSRNRFTLSTCAAVASVVRSERVRVDEVDAPPYESSSDVYNEEVR